jgi:THAP4-like, heme-binding beta-barrel domain
MTIPPDLPAELIPLAFLLGTWQGVGVGGYPTIDDFQFGQEVVIRHEPGTPYLEYESRTWRLDEQGRPDQPLARERGYWRMAADEPAGVELTLAHPTGVVEIWLGTVDGAKVELQTDVVARTSTAPDVSAGHRLYGRVEGDLLWAYDLAGYGQPLQPHMSARLQSAG